MGVTPVTSVEQFREIINKDKITIFDFWATWCGPCRVISPFFEELSNRFPSVEFYKVDVDEASDIAQEVGVRAMPTFIAYKSGGKVGDLVGANKQNLEALINTHAT